MQTGGIHALAHWRSAAGDYLAVGGTDAATSVALVSRAQGTASWPSDTGLSICPACPGERPAAAYLFPMSELHRSLSRPAGFVYRPLPTADRLRIDADDGPRPAAIRRPSAWGWTRAVRPG